MKMQLAVCFAVLLLLGIEFSVFGVLSARLFRLKFRIYETGIFGFFVYFGLFQIAALPLILLQRPFHELVVLWLVVLAVVNILALVITGRELGKLLRAIAAGFWRGRGILLAAVILLLAFCCWFHGIQQYVGWDTTYYIGTVDTTVLTDSMYVYNGGSGGIEKTLDFRYALSSFYMHSAFLCRLTGIGGLLVQKYVLGTLCILMHGWIMFAIGRRAFPGVKKALFMVGLVFVMHLGFHTGFSTSDFLLIRAYEAKGFCANVVIPALFYAIFCLWQDAKKREHWFLAFLVCFSSIPLSMSSLVIVPAMMVVYALAEWLTVRKWQILWRAFWCVLPNGIYFILYFMYTAGFRIAVMQS